MGAEIFHTLKKALHDAGHNTNVGDEGGFAPNLKSPDEALTYISKSVEKAGYKLGEEVFFALDPASTEFFKDGKYVLEGEGKTLSPDEMVKVYADLCKRYPIVSIEDGMAEDDWAGWKALTDAVGKTVNLVGDDLFVTNVKRLKQGIDNAHRQRHPDQGQPDRLADRDAGDGRDGAQGRLQGGDEPSFGRDRRQHHCRSGGRHQLRPDQDRLAGALGPAGQVQPAAAHRGTAGRCGAVCGAFDPAVMNSRHGRAWCVTPARIPT